MLIPQNPHMVASLYCLPCSPPLGKRVAISLASGRTTPLMIKMKLCTLLYRYQPFLAPVVVSVLLFYAIINVCPSSVMYYDFKNFITLRLCTFAFYAIWNFLPLRYSWLSPGCRD